MALNITSYFQWCHNHYWRCDQSARTRTHYQATRGPLPYLLLPVTIVLNYAALDFIFTSWMTPDTLRVLHIKTEADERCSHPQSHCTPSCSESVNEEEDKFGGFAQSWVCVSVVDDDHENSFFAPHSRQLYMSSIDTVNCCDKSTALISYNWLLDRGDMALLPSPEYPVTWSVLRISSLLWQPLTHIYV